MAGLTACGSDGGSDGDKAGSGGGKKEGGSLAQGAMAALQKASTNTEKQQSAKADGVQKQTVQGKSIESKMKGSFDWSSQGIQGNAEITMDGAGAQGAGGGQATQARYLSDAMYMKMATPVKGKQWLKYGYDAMAEKGGASGAMLKDQLQNNNPARSVQLLLASGKVKSVGSETVRGQKATHYTGTLKLSELVKMQSKDLKESDKKALEQQFKQQGLEKEKIDLWIGEDDLLVKKREAAKSSNGGFDNTVFYSDYGTKVDVTAPPAGQTMSFEEAMAGAGPS
ncbi:hypothetical protein [Streptomyces iconiensis]|uniref:Lipoprotein n=1 Tax=Streptomyces iconiensis TaxID=1384038 RepID=A0ABT7A9Z5_9ACTN|nr:hypothetical protein [Streptomyces iconiensis]MDJ1138181.1 hypothetical protein [Streptomyces iconiensis]